MSVAGWRFTCVKRTLRVRAVIVAVPEELPFVCPVVIAIGSLIMIGMMIRDDRADSSAALLHVPSALMSEHPCDAAARA